MRMRALTFKNHSLKMKIEYLIIEVYNNKLLSFFLQAEAFFWSKASQPRS